MSLPLMVPWACKSRRHLYGVRAALTCVTQVDSRVLAARSNPSKVGSHAASTCTAAGGRATPTSACAAEALGVGPSQSPQVLSVLAEYPVDTHRLSQVARARHRRESVAALGMVDAQGTVHVVSPRPLVDLQPHRLLEARQALVERQTAQQATARDAPAAAARSWRRSACRRSRCPCPTAPRCWRRGSCR